MKRKMVLFAMIIAIMAATLSVCFIPATASAESTALPSGVTDSEIGEKIDAFLQDHRSNHAAVATAVFRGDDDIYTSYFGYIDEAGTQPLSEQCVLEWGSTTKLTVWVSAMQLYEAGLLDLNADVRTYLPAGFLKNLRFDAPVTMLNLMNHNAGFQETDFVLEVYREEDILPLSEYLATYQPAQVFAPGSVVAYSNWGAALAGYIVECISGMPYWQYAQQHIFAPLGMEHTAVNSDLSDNPWVREKRKDFVSYLPDGSLSEDENKCFIIPYPAGMCTSTLSDFVRFARALLTRDSRLLSDECFEALYAPSLYYTDTDVARVAHGFLIDYDFSVPIFGHDGNTLGGSSRLLLDFQNNVGMVMLTNQLGGSVYRNGMAELVFGASEHHIEVDGYYVPARNVFYGKQKLLYNLFFIEHAHITSEMTDGMYINVLPDRFELSTCDYLVPTVNYQARDAFTVIWFVLLAYAGLIFVTRLIFTIIGAVKKKPFDLPNLLSAIYSLLLMLSALSIHPAIPGIVVLVYASFLGALGVAYAVYLALNTKRMQGTRLSRLSYWQGWSLLVCLAVTIANVIIWDLTI